MLRFLPALVPLCAFFWSELSAVPIDDVDPSTVVIRPAEEPAPVPDTAKPEEGTPAQPLTVVGPVKMPFVGVIKVTAANVRGGPSANHYPVVRLNQGTEVEVLKEQFGWYQIAPPAGTFCWIHKDFVTVAPDGRSGTVTGQNVNVRGDSILGHTAVKSDVVDQVSAGAKVTVVGTGGDFLRIEPTPGAKVYVRADLVAPKDRALVAETPGPAVKPRPPADLAVESFRKAEEALEAERLKPPTDWDLDKLAGLFREAQGQATTSRMKALIESRLLYLDRLVRLKGTLDEVERGRDQTEAALKAIEQRLAAEEAARAAAPEKTSYTLTGVLKTLELSDGRPRFKLVHPDDPKKILCVVEGEVDALRPLVDRRVGINGEFRVTAEWPVKVLQVSAVEPLASGEDTRIALPPADTK